MKHYLLKNPLVKVVVTREMVKCFESIGNKNTTYQNLLATTKATLGGKFTVLNAYFEKKKGSQINNLCFHLIKTTIRAN